MEILPKRVFSKLELEASYIFVLLLHRVALKKAFIEVFTSKVKVILYNFRKLGES